MEVLLARILAVARSRCCRAASELDARILEGAAASESTVQRRSSTSAAAAYHVATLRRMLKVGDRPAVAFKGRSPGIHGEWLPRVLPEFVK